MRRGILSCLAAGVGLVALLCLARPWSRWAPSSPRGVGTIAQENLRAGQAWCFITDRGGVGWLKLTGMSRGDPDDARLTFSLTMWGQRL